MRLTALVVKTILWVENNSPNCQLLGFSPSGGGGVLPEGSIHMSERTLPILADNSQNSVPTELPIPIGSSSRLENEEATSQSLDWLCGEETWVDQKSLYVQNVNNALGSIRSDSPLSPLASDSTPSAASSLVTHQFLLVEVLVWLPCLFLSPLLSPPLGPPPPPPLGPPPPLFPLSECEGIRSGIAS